MTSFKNGYPLFLNLVRIAAAFTFVLLFVSGRSATAQAPPAEASLERLAQGTQRAKTIAQIPPALVRALKREYQSSPELRAETNFESYLAGRYFWLMESVALKSGYKLNTSQAVAPMCADGRCDGPLDPNVWAGAWTGGSAGLISDANLPIATWTAGIIPNDNSIGIDLCNSGDQSFEAHHSIVPSGADPEIPGLKTVAPTPALNPSSLRLGNRCIGYGGERISKTFTVMPGQTTLQFWYATVFQNPSDHPAAIQPGFGAYLFNGATPVPNRIDIDPTTPGNQSFIVADQNNPFFGVKQDATVVVYRDWTCVTVDLTGLEGQTLTLVLVNRDCGAGGHWGYTYVDSLCLGCAGSSTGDVSFNQAQSACAQGKICFDYTVPRLPNGTNGKANLTLAVYQNGALVNTLTSGDLTTSGTYCFTNAQSGLTPSVGYDWKATAVFSVPGASIAPIEIGKTGEGFVAGNNNDCTPSVNPCCPPWNVDRLAEMMFYQGSGSISAPYTLKFQPTPAFKSQMQAYIDYLHSTNTAIKAITIDWRLHDQGTGVTPSGPLGPQVDVTAYTTWTSPGNGNPAVSGDPSFFSSPQQYPMVIGTWYRVHTGIYLENGQVFFGDNCAVNEIWVRVQVLKAFGPEPVLELWSWNNVIKRIPLRNFLGNASVKSTDEVNGVTRLPVAGSTCSVPAMPAAARRLSTFEP